MNEILLLFLQAIYFMVPAYFANMTPVFTTKHGLLKTPVDNYQKVNKGRIFGDHKTIGGVIFGILAGIVLFIVQILLKDVSFFKSISIIDYSWGIVYFGFLLGAGAILGDLVKSFFKRRVRINPGKSWFPFDQWDFVVGALLLSAIAFIPSWKVIIAILVISMAIHLVSGVVSKATKLKEDWI